MDWSNFWANLVGNGVLLAVAIWILKIWIESGIQHDYAEKLETIKADLRRLTETELQRNAYLLQQEEQRLDTDRVLFRDILDLLPSDRGAIDYLRNGAFGERWDRDATESLSQFVNVWDVPERTFHNREVEDARSKFVQKSRQLLGCLARETYPNDYAPGRVNQVPPDMETHDNQRFRAIVDEIGDFADQVIAAHENLIRTGKAGLSI